MAIWRASMEADIADAPTCRYVAPWGLLARRCISSSVTTETITR